MTEQQIRTVIVDDQAPFRSAARAVLGLTDGFEVVGEADSGEEAVRLGDSLLPELFLMDINMPGMSGIEATRQITRAHPETVVVLLSTYAADELPSDARACGAATYLNKEAFGPVVLREVWSEHGNRC